MERYADMVYPTCRRILREEALAAGAVQETFFQLAKNGEKIKGSMVSWLHKVATRRGVDLIRRATWTLICRSFYTGTGSFIKSQPVVHKRLDHVIELLAVTGLHEK